MYTSNAIVLSTQNKAENDIFASLYTQKFGKIRVVVKGSRKLQTKQGNFLHNISINECSFVSSKAGYILAGIQNKKNYPYVNNNLFAAGYVSSFLNVMDRATYEGQSDEDMWNLIVSGLEDAETTTKDNEDPKNVLWEKEKMWMVDLLGVLGLKPQNIDMDGIKTQKELDKLIKNLLETNLGQRVEFFAAK